MKIYILYGDLPRVTTKARDENEAGVVCDTRPEKLQVPSGNHSGKWSRGKSTIDTLERDTGLRRTSALGRSTELSGKKLAMLPGVG